VISWLPAAHVAERNAHYYLPVTKGVSVHVCADPRRIAEYLPKVNPTWFFAVPRIFEKLKAGLEAMMAGLPDEQREPVEKGLEASLQKVRLEQSGEEVPPEVAEAAAQADEQMFSHLRKQLGLDEALAVNAGAAPTPLEVLEFFHAIGIPIGELWGMSETAGSHDQPTRPSPLGTVGPPRPASIRLDEDGEVLIADRDGYATRPRRTRRRSTTTAGCALATSIDEDGYLRSSTARREINAAGKNMSPANIEAHPKTASP
jgi:long-subunit acyl-CoA synthetase (AMP-forming)